MTTRRRGSYPKTLVEDCELIIVSTATGNLALHGITFEYSRGGRGGQRRWFRCPRCNFTRGKHSTKCLSAGLQAEKGSLGSWLWSPPPFAFSRCSFPAIRQLISRVRNPPTAQPRGAVWSVMQTLHDNISNLKHAALAFSLFRHHL